MFSATTVSVGETVNVGTGVTISIGEGDSVRVCMFGLGDIADFSLTFGKEEDEGFETDAAIWVEEKS